MSTYLPATWRLLITPPTDGATNMAIDEAILQALAIGQGLPTLRFYQWNPPCLSLGYNQHYSEVDQDACARLGYTWLRRPTGGRAILHTDELTYSVVAPLDEPRVLGGIVDSYRRLSAGLLAGLRALGADVFQAQQEKVLNPSPSAVCFDTPSNYEITVQGKKVVGSAQVRRRGIVLQHGSVPLIGDLSRIFACLHMPESVLVEANGGPSPAPGRASAPTSRGAPSQADWRDWLLARAATLEQVLGRRVSFDEAAHALTQGFAQALNLHLEPGQLSDYERSLMQSLRRDQYANERWNRRV
jgi:lipoate-protein ligase A